MLDRTLSLLDPAVFNPAADSTRNPAKHPSAPRIALVPPIRFPSDPFTRTDVGRQDAFEARQQRIAADTERRAQVLRTARESGFEQGRSRGWTQGARFGFGLGLVVGCALIAASLLAGVRVGLG